MQKLGDFKSSIVDCDLALEVISSLSNLDTAPDQFKSLKIKLMLKKANAYEMTEKYMNSFIEYESLMKLDSSNHNVQQGYNRLKNILTENGQINKVRQAKPSKQAEPVNEQVEFTTKSDKELAAKEDLTKLYEDYKLKGNEFVKVNDFKKALEFYTKCIELNADNPLAYLNRSLCYVKLNEAELAIKDCSYVLEKENKNVKALFRRACANKLKKNYNLAESDLKELLAIEPNNQIAQQDLKALNELLKREDVNLKKTNVLIKEITSDASKPTVVESNVKESKKMPTKPVVNRPTPPVVSKSVSFSKISNAYEFLQGWNSIHPKDLDSYALILTCMDASNLPTFIGSKLDDEMLCKLIRSIHKLQQVSNTKIADYLKYLSKTQRFDVIKLFIDKEHSNMLREILAAGDFSQSDADYIKKSYNL